MFKFIGAVLGYTFLGLAGAMIGFFIGLLADRARTYGSGGMNPFANAQRQAVFLETLFISMGRLAKADGRVSEDEIAHVEALMQRLGMTAEHRTRAIALFKQGVAPECDLAPVYVRFLSVCGETRHLRQTLLVFLVATAFADGRMHAAEDALLVDIAARLGFDEAGYRQLVDMVTNRSHFGDATPNATAPLEDAYKALGVTKDSTDAEIKRAYRKLMSQYHPDKLIGQGLPEDMIALATEQSQEIQRAYELIRKVRGTSA